MLWKFNYTVRDEFFTSDHSCVIFANSFKEAKEYFYNYVNEQCFRFNEILIEDSIIVKELDIGNPIVYYD